MAENLRIESGDRREVVKEKIGACWERDRFMCRMGLKCWTGICFDVGIIQEKKEGWKRRQK